MATTSPYEHVVIGVTPFGEPNARLVAAVCRAGGLGVLDLGAGDRRGRDALALTAEWAGDGFGVRLAGDTAMCVAELPPAATTVVLAPDTEWQPELADRRVLVEVTDVDAAVAAVTAGAAGLIARGNEAGGPVGETSTFVLLQQLLTHPAITVPVWACGGIGEHTAAAAVLGGAAGVVLDVQLALLDDSDLAPDITAALAGLDGSETTVADGQRVLRRRDSGPVLPVGQDGFLAARFAARWRTVADAVRGVRDAIIAAARNPTAGTLLRPGTPMSRALGTTLPVAQGPMTRVSDRAGFAAAVADHGALPFIALALANGERTREMLTETRAALGDRPWGVGVLGFAAEETRAAQLAVIEELRPSHVIIAGGRPGQAAALERAGIRTFLHVPSPGLLGQFLTAGARRFVFEGAECGGHVGPRNSFPLWEAQLGVLAAFLDGQPNAAGDVEILLAGGVHDERSAAMAATLAAPLADRGVAVGVLMGTAYLFTEEAVSTGAVLPLFQRQVLAAHTTDLLETAPGHATRCVRSPFTEEYASIKAGLAGDREAWETLERLNVGRLRVASKGVRREGAELVAVPEDEQLADGMFMAGDVARLRSAVTTIAGLHTAVSLGAAEFLADRAATLRARWGVPEPAAPAPLDIAVIGMSCMFPQAEDLQRFWANVLAGVDAITEVPVERWDPEVYHAPNGTGERSSSKWGGFLPDIPFDPLRYGIPPASLPAIEPVQLLALEAAHRALVDAGYGERAFDRARTGVVFGAEAGSDLSNASALKAVLPAYVGELPAELAEQLPTLTEDSFPGMLANVIAGRIANRLDLGGANYTVDAACASSLAAVDVACKQLRDGSSDLVLCGGADLHNGINDYLLFSSVHALSPTGRSRTFDASADGIALGEGVACVALKRLADAERDGDRVYAVIKGVGSASDGRSLGLTAPRPDGQRAALERAYRNAGISPAEVGLLEAHGTGTVVGDRTELVTLTEVFTEAGADPASCALGSVKSQIGHTKCAAGMAGLIKAALALHTGVLPPTLHVQQPNPAWDGQASPFVFHDRPRPWAEPPAGRVAGVSAFGFGGTNFHIVLRAHAGGPPPAAGLADWPAELFLFRGNDLPAAQRTVDKLLELVETGRWRLRELARTASGWSDAGRGPVRIAVVADDVAGLADRLRRARAGQADPRGGIHVATTESAPRVAWLFPGQGSQRPGMLAELFVAFPELHRHLAPDLADTVFPPAAFDPAGREEQVARVTDTRVAQPALGMTGLAMADLLRRAGVEPAAVAGHSYGELAALAAAGALDADRLPALSARRSAAILGAAGADPGTMAAVAADAERVAQALDPAGSVVLANLNSPKQTVISGPTPDVLAAIERLREQGLGVKRISVACAFHSPVVAGARERFAEELAMVPVRGPEIPVWANRTATPYPAEPDAVRAELAEQIVSPVRFADQIEAMYADGIRVFVEAGPGSVLTRLVSATLGDRPHETVTVQPDARSGLADFLGALARLAVSGVPVRTGWLFRGRDTVDVTTAVAVRQPGWTVNGHLLRTTAGEIPAGALRPARRIQYAPGGERMNGADRDTVISDFLRTSRDMVAAQRDVLLAYLGGPAAAPAPAPVPVVVAEPVTVEAPAEPATVDVLRTVLDIISERTGYPADMIEPDLDLEADLSIDSIKRAEIVGELAERLGIGGQAGDEDLEELSRAKTAAGIADLLRTRIGDPPEAPEPVEPVAAPIRAPRRFVVEPVPITAGAPMDVAGRRFAVLGRGELAERITALLTERGATTSTELAGVDGVCWLDPWTGTEPVLPDGFATVKAALAENPRWLLTASPAADPRVDGLRGLFRTLDREYPDTVTRLVEFPPDTPAGEIAAGLLAPADSPVVLHGTGRHGLDMVAAELGLLGSTGAGPAGDGAAEAEAAGLDRESVVLLLGGGRGITARFATALATACRCRLELAGRTALPATDEDPATAHATTPAELRTALLATGLRAPAEVERAVAAILARREIGATVAGLRELGSPTRYHVIDGRDREAVHRLVKQVHAEYGRLDGVVCAAGVIEDKLVADKDPDSFRRVFETKVESARAILEATADLPAAPGFAVLFGSIAAVLGNRGQSDYAAANDALEWLGRRWAATTGGRALTVHWGPWAPGDDLHTGMVGHELMRSYARRGISLIDPDEGPASLLRELAWGDRDAVVYTASGW